MDQQDSSHSEKTMAADQLERQSGPERAIRYLRAADSTLARLASTPSMGTRYAPDEPIYPDLRSFPRGCGRS
jgi:plasmid stabilization system protein ParE